MLTRTILTAFAAVLVLAPTVQAGHDRYAPRPAVAALAHELELAARHVHHTAEDLVHPRDFRERNAVLALHRLEQRARHFHRTVERGASPFHLDRDFARLFDAYDVAAYEVGFVRSRHVRADFRRVDHLMNRLSRQFDVAYRYPAHGRHTHGEVVFGDRHRYSVRVRW